MKIMKIKIIYSDDKEDDNDENNDNKNIKYDNGNKLRWQGK